MDFGKGSVCIVEEAEGSSQFQFGDTIVQCLVYGPEKWRQRRHEYQSSIELSQRVFWKSLDTKLFTNEEKRYFEQYMEGVLTGNLMISDQSKTTYTASGTESGSLCLGSFYPYCGMTIVFIVLHIPQNTEIPSPCGMESMRLSDWLKLTLKYCAIQALSLSLIQAGIPLKSTFFAVPFILFKDVQGQNNSPEAFHVQSFPNINSTFFNTSVLPVATCLFILENTNYHNGYFHSLDFKNLSNVHESTPSLFIHYLPNFIESINYLAPNILSYFKSILNINKS